MRIEISCPAGYPSGATLSTDAGPGPRRGARRLRDTARHPRETRQVDGGPFYQARIAFLRQHAKPRRIEEFRGGEGAVEARFVAPSGPPDASDLPVTRMDLFLGQTEERPRLLAHEPSGYTCAAFASKVACWDPAALGLPRPGPAAGTFVALWTAAHSACARTDAGAVWCWGTGEPWLQAHDSFNPIRIVGLDGADEVAACSSMVCARREASVDCTRAADLEKLRAAIPDDGGHRIGVSALRISCCMDLACALTTEHDVACWSGTFEPVVRTKGTSELGDGPLCGKRALDHAPTGPEKEVTGADTTCWVDHDGTARCTGVPAGNGVELDTTTTHALPGALIVKDALVDRVEWCLQSGDEKWTCSPRLQEPVSSRHLQTGEPMAKPEALADSEGTTAIAQGRFAICLTDRGDRTRCRRRTYDGTRGPEIVLSGIDRLAIGNSHACALDLRGGLSCWGANESGQVTGDRSAAMVEAPVHVLDEVTDVTVGLRHTCAALHKGTIVCFGDNRYGQLGNGTTSPASGMVRVVRAEDTAARVTAGFDHTCALTQGGSVFCWGSDSSDPRVPVESFPTRVDGLAGPVRAIAAGRDANCAVLVDASVACWGEDGWRGGVATPQRVKGTESTVELAMGDHHACVRSASGAVKCFGSNAVGQLATDLPWTRTEIQPPKSCLAVTYFPTTASSSGVDVAW